MSAPGSVTSLCHRAGDRGELGAHLLWAMAMTPESGVMMRFWDCCGLWWDRLWMLVRVLTGGSPPPDTEICREQSTTGTVRAQPPALSCTSWGHQQSPLLRGERAAVPLGLHPYTPRVQSLTAAPQVGVNIQQNSNGKEFAGTGFQLHRSVAPEHGTSQAFAVLYPKSKLQPTGTAEGF